MCVILFMVLLPDPPQPQTRILGSGGPKFSNSRSVSAVGTLAGALQARLGLLNYWVPLPLVRLVHPRHPCLLRPLSAFFAFLTFDGVAWPLEWIIIPIRNRESKQPHYLQKYQPFTGKRDKAKVPPKITPRLAQLARAPDCRLETLGCRQPSGGPRFKSGSADHYLINSSSGIWIAGILNGNE